MLNENNPWLEEDGWKNGQIHSSAKKSFYIILFFALFWNLISFPATYLALSDAYRGWNINHLDPALIILIFPIIGITLAIQAYKNYQQWSAFGLLSMTLDPYPASIGGEAGGFLELPVAWRSGYDFSVTLNCIHHTITRSSKNSSHHQKVVWKSFAAVDYEASEQGIRLKFKTPIDKDLHESTPKSGNSYYRWVAHIKGHYKNSKMSLDREFDIPVFKLQSAKHSHLIISASAPEVAAEDIHTEQVQIKQNSHSLQLNYPRSRYLSIGSTLLVFSLIFITATGFLGYNSVSSFHGLSFFSLFSSGITGFMTLIFGLIGLIMLGYAIHLLSSRLSVLIDANGLQVKNRSLVYRSDQSVKFSQINSITKKSSLSTGEGVSATRYFTITAQYGGYKKLILGNGIKGQLEAESLIKLINKYIKDLTGKK